MYSRRKRMMVFIPCENDLHIKHLFRQTTKEKKTFFFLLQNMINDTIRQALTQEMKENKFVNSQSTTIRRNKNKALFLVGSLFTLIREEHFRV